MTFGNDLQSHSRSLTLVLGCVFKQSLIRYSCMPKYRKYRYVGIYFRYFGILNIDIGIGICKYRDIGIGIPTHDSTVPLTRRVVMLPVFYCKNIFTGARYT